MTDDIAVNVSGEANVDVSVSATGNVSVSMNEGVDWDEIGNKPSTFPPEYPSGGEAGNVLTKTAIGVEWAESGSGASSWDALTGKPFNTVGENLKVVNGSLSVDTASVVEQDNTKPVTSAAVHTEIGNIEALMATI